MPIEIQQPAPPKYRSLYVAEIKFMHGDADLDTTEEILLDTAEDVELFDDSLKYIVAHSRNKRPSGDMLRDRSFTSWFYSYQPYDFESDLRDGSLFKSVTTYDEALDAGYGECYWPKDEFNTAIYASFSAVQYWWYSEDGTKHRVIIRKDAQ